MDIGLRKGVARCCCVKGKEVQSIPEHYIQTGFSAHRFGLAASASVGSPTHLSAYYTT